MKKLTVIINGKGGAGKDTLCDLAAKYYRVRNVSSITPIKEIAAQNGWNGEKDSKSRKFLSDLKRLFVEYNDLPNRYLLQQYREFMEGEEQILFVHIRETDEIDKFKNSLQGNCITLLIQREVNRGEKWGNVSDDEVDLYTYDYYFRNDGELLIMEQRFRELLEKLLSESEV